MLIPAPDVIFSPDLWSRALESYTRAARLTVKLFDAEARIVLGPVHPTPLVQLFEETIGYDPGLFTQCAQRCVTQENGRRAEITSRYGLSVVGIPLVLDDRIVGAAVAGYALVDFVHTSEVEHLARDCRVSFERIWRVAREEKPIPQRRLILNGELLQVLGDALLKENRRTRQYEHALEKLEQTSMALRDSEEKFRLFVENVHEYALVQTDAAGRIATWNPGAQRLFGYTIQDVLGQSFSALLTSEDRAAGIFKEELATVANGHYKEDARWLVRADGSRFWARWITEPIRNDHGSFRGMARVIRDETEREQAEAKIRASLEEKEELLKEVHHRVKNNLQVIISLLNLQARQIEEKHVLALFEEVRNRVLAISAIHELLYRGESFAQIRPSHYARQLAQDLVRFYGVEDRVTLEILGEDPTLELERAVPYAMLLNELVSNACKHAFPPPLKGNIRIAIGSAGDLIEVIVSDTGKGLPPGFDYQQTSSLGLSLVHGLVRQLGGTLEIQSQEGTSIRIQFPAPGTDAEE